LIISLYGRHELAKGLAKLGMVLNDKELGYLFEILDVNGDGSIELSEFLDCMATYRQAQHSHNNSMAVMAREPKEGRKPWMAGPGLDIP